jgi:hypothetical protein
MFIMISEIISAVAAKDPNDMTISDGAGGLQQRIKAFDW